MALPRQTSFVELRQRWREFSQEAGPVLFLLKSLEGAALPESGCLGELVPPRKGALVLHVLSAAEKSVRLLGAGFNPVAVRLLPHESTLALTQRVKRLVGVEGGRVARLLCGGRVLAADTPPCAQLADCAFIDLDLQCRFLACCVEAGSLHQVLRNELGGYVQNKDLTEEERQKGIAPSEPNALPAFATAASVRELSLFASEPARAMTGAGEWCATAWGGGSRIAEAGAAVSALVSEAALLSGAVTGVVLERRMEVVIEERLRQRSTCRKVTVWPSVKLGDFLTNDNDVVLLNGEPADPCQTLWEAGVQEGGCLRITRLLPLSVSDEKGVVRRVTADLGMSLRELRQLLSFPEDDFELWSGGEVLCGDESSLLELEVDATSPLLALPRRRTVTLKAGRADPVQMGDVAKTTTFHAFLQTASEALKTQLSSQTRFVCACGRVFSCESAERREFPLRCCRAPELRFAVEEPPKNQASQTAVRKKEVACQAVGDSCEEETQTDRTERRTMAQASHAVDQVATQIHDEPTGVAHFTIEWRFNGGEEFFDLEIPFWSAVRGRKLRAAIAKARAVAPGSFKLRQYRARRRNDGAAVFCIKEGDFADAHGEKSRKREVEATERHYVSDDEPVGTTGPLHARIFVPRKSTDRR